MSATRLARFLASVALCSAALSAAAQAWPEHPLRWIIPYAPGGTSDTLTRIVGQKLGERLGQPVLVENRPGAGGNLGTDFVAKATPDGYTMVLGNIGPMAINQSLYKSLPYDPEKDLVPVTLLLSYPNVILANMESGPKTFNELLQRARTQRLSFAGNGIGTSQHLAGELLATTAKIQLQHVPYRGGPPGLTDTMAAILPIALEPEPSAIPFIRGGKLRALAVTSLTRSAMLPDVPTVAESGFPGFEVTGWVGVLLPKDTPAAIVNRLIQEFTAIMQSPDVVGIVAQSGGTVPTLGPAYFAGLIHSEAVRWRQVITTANIKSE